MLRGAGRTGKLTDNFDACRDLNGRRIRHQEAEKRLAEWVAEEKQRELERVAQAHIKQQLRQERQEQIEKARAVSPHPPPASIRAIRATPPSVLLPPRLRVSSACPRVQMNAAIVREVQATNIKGVKEAVTSGLALVTTTSNKRKNGGDGPAPQRKSLKVWGMEEPDSDSDGDSDDDDREDSGGGVAEGAATAVVTKAEEQVGPPPDEARQEEPKGPDAEDREGSGPLDLSRFETAKDLEVAGLEVLKAELQRHGLKCGGSLTQRAERLFLIKSTPLDQIDKAHFAKK